MEMGKNQKKVQKMPSVANITISDLLTSFNFFISNYHYPKITLLVKPKHISGS